MNKFRTLCATLVVSCAMNTPSFADETKDYTILEIGDKKVKYSEVMNVWNSVFPSNKAPDFATVDPVVKKNVLHAVIGEHLLYDKAVESGIENKPDVKKKLAAVRKKTLVDAFLDTKSASKVTPATVKAEYERLRSEATGEMEVRASHILVEDKETAERLLKRLKTGSDFEKIAKEFSNDKASAVAGGDLGYFTKDKMVKEFADAAFSTKKGSISAPVKSDFGWHIIKVDDKRERGFPPFMDKRVEIERKLRAETLSQYINDLVDRANVKYFDADGKELELHKH